MPKEVKVSAANEHRQERRASARRGQRIVMPKEVRVWRQSNTVKSGARQPAVVSYLTSWRRIH
jgi:hypothetical protein